MNIVITGANGFIGSHLTEYFSKNGNQIYALVHHLYKQPPPNITYRAFDLNSFASDVVPDNTDIIIHTAYIPHKKGAKKNINEIASQRLYKIAKKKNVKKFIFISSLSASEDARSEYGKSKFNISNIISDTDDLILAPGLVIGNGGLYKKITNIIRSSMFIPLIGGGNQDLQYIFIEDLTSIIQYSIENNITGKYNIANKNNIKMKDFYKYVAKENNNKNIFIPLPYLFSDFIFWLTTILNIDIGINRESYLGLKNMKLKILSNTNDVFDIDLKSIR